LAASSRDGPTPSEAVVAEGGVMQMNVVELDAGVRRVELSGRLDTAGVAAIETKYSVVATGRAGTTLVDLGGVTFLASMGIRMLVACAKSAAAKGGRTALVRPQPLVERTLRDTGIDQIIPVAADEARAREILAA
jgi:anti-sigma B factor antagonist